MGIVQLFLWPCSMVFCMLTRGLMKIEGVLQVYPWKTTGFYDDRWYTSHRPKPIFTKRTLLIVISKIVIYQYLPNLSDLWTWSYFYIHHFFLHIAQFPAVFWGPVGRISLWSHPTRQGSKKRGRLQVLRLSWTPTWHGHWSYLPYIWVNYNDLTATSLESWLVREIIPKWP